MRTKMRMGIYMYCICLQDTHKHDLPVNTPAWKMTKKINKHAQRTHLPKHQIITQRHPDCSNHAVTQLHSAVLLSLNPFLAVSFQKLSCAHLQMDNPDHAAVRMSPTLPIKQNCRSSPASLPLSSIGGDCEGGKSATRLSKVYIC